MSVYLRSLVMRLVPMVLACAISLMLAGPTLAASERVRLSNKSTGKYLAVGRASKREGASVIQWKDENQKDIWWEIIRQGDRGPIKIRNVNSGLFLAIGGGATNDGASVIQWRDVNQRDIRWMEEQVDPQGRCFRYRNQNSGKYLAVEGNSRFNGANVIQWSNVNQPDIVWCKR